jgi:Domain of Unknown Function (DUF928)
MSANLPFVTVSLLLPVLVLTSLPGEALTYRPRGRVERPTQQEAGGARKPPCLTKNVPPLFYPLLTQANYGETIVEYPTFYWFSAHHNYTWVRFELFATRNLVPEQYPEYSATLRTQKLQKVSHFQLTDEAGFPPLKLNQEYLWKVTLICSPEGPDAEVASGKERSIQGWIKRVEPSPGFKAKLAQVNGQDLYNLYAEEGFWYDALDELARQYRTAPNNQEIAADWQALLKLLPVKIHRLARQLRP